MYLLKVLQVDNESYVELIRQVNFSDGFLNPVVTEALSPVTVIPEEIRWDLQQILTWYRLGHSAVE